MIFSELTRISVAKTGIIDDKNKENKGLGAHITE